MNIVNLAILNSGQTAFQLFYRAYTALGEGITDESIQNMYRFYELCDTVPGTVQTFCEDIIAGNRDVQRKEK